MTTATTVVNSYSFQPWFAWAMSMCVCGEERKSFFGPNNWQEQCSKFKAAGITFVEEGAYAPGNVVKSYTRIYWKLLRIPRAVDLTESDEALVVFFRYLLEHGEQP